MRTPRRDAAAPTSRPEADATTAARAAEKGGKPPGQEQRKSGETKKRAPPLPTFPHASTAGREGDHHESRRAANLPRHHGRPREAAELQIDAAETSSYSTSLAGRSGRRPGALLRRLTGEGGVAAHHGRPATAPSNDYFAARHRSEATTSLPYLTAEQRLPHLKSPSHHG
jgi:hypothetical protein